MSSREWILQTRGTIHPHRVGLFLTAHHQLAAKLIGVKDNFEGIYINEGENLWFVWDKMQFKSAFDKLISRINTPAKLHKYILKYDKILREAISGANAVKLANLSKLSNKKLIKLYKKLYQQSAPAHALLNVDIDTVDVYFEDYLKDVFKKGFTPHPASLLHQRFRKGTVGHPLPQERGLYDSTPSDSLSIRERAGVRGVQDFDAIFSQLIIPNYQTYITCEDKALVQAAIKKQKGLLKDGDIKLLWQKFWWTNLGWENVIPKSIKYFKDRTQELSTQDNLADRLKHFNTEARNIRLQRTRIIKETSLSPKLVYWLNVVDTLAFYHDRRKEMQVKTVYAYHLILKEVSRRFKYHLDDLEWLWADDVIALLKGEKLNIEEIENRKKAVCLIIRHHSMERYSGDEALLMHQKELPESHSDVKEITGRGVSGGVVRGVARVCSGAAEAIKKVDEGDVLICGMTLPDYVPAMRKAVAIVTNEGGITCHAAIISRELKKPCVVGTKIATQVFKDGDVLEVDAGKGIVRVI